VFVRVGLYGFGVWLMVGLKILLVLRWLGVMVGGLVDMLVICSLIFLFVFILGLLVFWLMGVVGEDDG